MNDCKLKSANCPKCGSAIWVRRANKDFCNCKNENCGWICEGNCSNQNKEENNKESVKKY